MGFSFNQFALNTGCVGRTHVPHRAPFRSLSSTMLRPPSLIKLALFASASSLVLVHSAWADELDTLQFRAGQSFQHDSNVFRLSDTPNAAKRSDTFGVTTLGVKLNKPLSLQRFEFDAEVQDHNYRSFSELDFTAVNYAAAWRWSLTPKLHGNFTGSQREQVDTSADVRATGLNRRTDRDVLFDAEYELDGVWRLLGGVYNRESSNSQPFTFERDSNERGAEAGVRYVYPSGSSLSYIFKQGSGDYSGRAAPVTSPPSFKDREHELRFLWALTGKTTVQTRVAYLDRQHDGFSARDFSGVVGQSAVTVALTGKTTVSAGVARELGSYQTETSSYFVANSLFLAPTWKPSEKTALRLRYDYGVRNYKGPLPGGVSDGRRDRTHVASMAFDWEPVRAVLLTASLQRDQRNSNLPNLDYRAVMVGLSALARF